MIHREGYNMILGVTAVLAILNYGLIKLGFPWMWLPAAISIVLLILVVQFFRNPTRSIPDMNDGYVYAPADGKVVVIEEVEEPEYFKDKRLQISIFMSPLNVHVNRAPIGGTVAYSKYHPGKYLVAWHPKSSTENERTTVVIEGAKAPVLLRQIAGAVARRIRNYAKEGQSLKQGQEYGFIKFGSRVDVFLPLGTEVRVSLDQKVSGNKTLLARLS